jgi:DNA-binding protein YbaB
MEKNRLENIWRVHEKSCNPNHHHNNNNHNQQHAHQQHNHSQNIVKVMKREDVIKQNQPAEKHQRSPIIQTPITQQQLQQQQQSHSIVRLNSIGNQNPNNLSIQTSLNEHDKNSLNLMLLQAANSALLTPNSAFANNSLETLLNQIDQQQQQQQQQQPAKSPTSHHHLHTSNNLESVFESHNQMSMSNTGASSSSSSNSGNTLQRPNNLNLRAGGNMAIGLNATPTPASLFLAVFI